MLKKFCWARTILQNFLVAVLSLTGAMSLAQTDSQSSFIRFLDGPGEFEGELQTAVNTYRNGDGVEVDLVAAVHIGEQNYFQTLNDYFSPRDAVLYELVAEAENRPDGTPQPQGGGLVSFLQRSLTDLLSLHFQLDSINYSRANFIHADLEPDELLQVMEAKGESLLSSFMALVVADMNYRENSRQAGRSASDQDWTLASLLRVLSAPDRQVALKYLMARGLASTGDFMSSLEAAEAPDMTLLHDRNEAAIQVLDATLLNHAVTNISIYYGAAHMAGLEQALQQRGFVLQSQRWLTAWSIP